MTDVIVLGLDGATWDLLDPLVDEGRLPNVERLRREGRAGVLESTVPPITPPAWLSMATGQNPGKTGVFYFLNRTAADDLAFEPMGTDDFRGRSFWDVMDARGRSAGVFNVPMFGPPYDLDGFVVAGFGAETEGALTSPPSLTGELEEATGGYEVEVPYADPKYAGRPERLERDLHRLLDTQERAIEYLLEEKRPDLFFGVVSVTDWAQHYFWRFRDPGHVLYEPGYEGALADLFARVDDVVGTVADVADRNDATLLLVSDHGFGPVNGTFYANAWLEREGFLHRERRSALGRLRSSYFPRLRRAVAPVVSRVPALNDLATRVGRSVRTLPAEDLDAERSVAFAGRQGLTGGLVYSLSDGADLEAVVSALRRACADRGLEVDVHRSAELYHGPKAALAPDVVFAVEGYEFAVDPRYPPGEEVFVDRPPEPARGGGHRREGMYVVAGPRVEPGEGERRSLLDVAPTLLALLSLPVPAEVDGEPMHAAFGDLPDPERVPLARLVDESEATGRGDATAVRDRLEDLGYL